MGLRLRDRDYIVGLNGLIFRVLGYTHPPDGYVCDLEYVPSHFYRSVNPKAPRGFRVASHYKLYGDEPFKLVKERFPEYRVFYKPLSINLPGVPLRLMKEVRLPTVGLKRLLESEKDELTEALRELLNRVLDSSGLKPGDFGVFGSLLFGFYHPMLSDIDLVVYGSSNLRELRDCLSELYREGFMVNEFTKPPKALNWRFTKYPLNLFLKHQRRKLVY
ncbi:MAG TPA: hypothetical protein EYP90_14335, partial [Chromatiaceae bacterium]|nr:hypothetical protein [Chromatiaceae bacterium]